MISAQSRSVGYSCEPLTISSFFDLRCWKNGDCSTLDAMIVVLSLCAAASRRCGGVFT